MRQIRHHRYASCESAPPAFGVSWRLLLLPPVTLLAFAGLAALLQWPALAQDSAGAKPPVDPGHTAWMLTSSALVLLMTPGLALFYGGMVRSKNVLGTIMHSVFAMGIVTIVWVIVGYSIAFGKSQGGWFGNPVEHLFLENVPYDNGPVPDMVFMVFQLMFAIITPALITGAFAERIKFGGYTLFVILWSLLVYSPLAHWVWGGGILSGDKDNSLLVALTGGAGGGGVGALDFAGGTVVHISSGISALVFVLLVSKRKGYPDIQIKPNNLVLTMLGAGILWFGWFGFNGGSAVASNGVAALAFVVTHICAAAGAVSWAVVEKIHRGKASALGVASGLVAGLVCITPASGYVLPMAALIMGLIVGPVCYFFVAVIKERFGYDDSLDVFGIHGIGGTLGAVLTGLFCRASLGNGVAGGFNKQLVAQIVGVLVTWVFAGVATAILVKVVDATVGLRVSDSEEEEGLDLSQHGEVGYNL